MTTRDALPGRLTPRGAEILASLLEEMRDEVLQSAARRSLDSEISARDVIEAFDERLGDRHSYASQLSRRSGRLQILLLSYAAIAAALAVVALLVTTIGNGGTTWAGPLAASSIGIVGSSLALMLVTRRRDLILATRLQEAEKLQGGFATFMERWLRIESLLRLLVSRDLGKSAGELSLGAILDSSARSGILDAETFNALRELLAVRNEAVHVGDVDEKALVDAIQSANHLVARLEERLASGPSRAIL